MSALSDIMSTPSKNISPCAFADSLIIPIMFPRCVISKSSTPAASTALIEKFTFVLPPVLCPEGIISPAVSGMNTSGPCSPTI